MPLGTLDRTPPPFFRQGPSALSKLIVCSALAVFLMVADVRFNVTQPLRAVVANALYPARWIVLRPVGWFESITGYFQSLRGAQQGEAQARLNLGKQALRANQVEQLLLENTRLRALLDLRARVTAPALIAQVLYDAADPYSRKIIIDRGTLADVRAGAPVIDEAGVLGQVTRAYTNVSEVTLIIDRDQAIPVLNTRTGARGVAFGDPTLAIGGLELRFMAANNDIEPGDILATSGVDGVYPPGLQVARVDKVERRAESSFARVHLVPIARVGGTSYVMVLQPVAEQIAARPPAEAPPEPAPKKGLRK